MNEIILQNLFYQSKFVRNKTAINNKFNPWYKQRDMPSNPKQTFGEWYKMNVKEKAKNDE